MRATPVTALLLVSFGVAGCASTPPATPKIDGALPAQAMVKCEELPLLEDMSPGAKSKWIGAVAPSYAKCANKVKALTEWINDRVTAPPAP